MNIYLRSRALLAAFGALALSGCLRVEFPAEACDNTTDDDGDGFVDCADSDCAAEPACQPGAEDCDNNLDDDGDGNTDCDDADCAANSVCQPGVEDCDNNLDDDDDEQVDCDDADCAASPACQPGAEDCDNGQDDDGDGLVDCADPNCTNNPACGEVPACATQQVPAALGDNTGDNTGGSNFGDGSCQLAFGGGGGLETIFSFTPAQQSLLTLVLSSETDQGIHVRSDCADENSELGCADNFFGGADETLSLNAQAGQPLSIFVDAFLPGEEGPFTLTLSVENLVCGDGVISLGEQCDDGNTADGDGCSSLCQLENAFTEIEPNNTADTANDFAAIAINDNVTAQINPSGDLDFFVVTVPPGQIADLRVESLNGPLGTTCTSLLVDTEFDVFDADGNVLANDDDGGDGFCSLINLGGLPEGDYFIRVKSSDFDPTGTFDYTLNLVLVSVVCGDGVVAVAEACDDGNTADGDGCDAACQTEDGFICSGEPSVCEVACGNGTLNLGETCDDGNTTAGDGCDIVCQTEDGFACSGEPSVCIDLGPACDAATPALLGDNLGDTTGAPDAFDGSCQLGGAPELLFSFTPGGNNPGILTLTLTSDVDLGVYARIDCADAASELGCVDNNFGAGAVETLVLDISDPSQALTIFVDGFVTGEEGPFTLNLAFEAVVCGDGVILDPEGCDDGNTADGDGCDAACQIEDGFVCSGAPSVCVLLADSCLLATPIIPGVNAGDTSNNPDLFDGSCQLGGAPEQFFSFTPGGTDPGLLTIQLESDADLGVYVRTDCADAASELGCVDNDFGAGAVETLVLDISDPSQALTIFVDGFATGEEGPFTLVVAFGPPVCGNGLVEPGEACDEGANNGLPGSVCALDCTLAPEAECSNLLDEDNDGLFDCEDIDCVNAGQCISGAAATGAPCTEATDCQANDNDPFCIGDLDFDFPAGYCSEFCDLVNNDCAGDANCLDIGLPSGNGLCFDGCNIDNDCRAGYFCDDGDLDGVPESCLPL